jgi:hypothetical protein
MRVSKEVAVYIVQQDIMRQMNVFIKTAEVEGYLKRLILQERVYQLENRDIVSYRNKHWQITRKP